MMAGLGLAIKVGGCEAIKDMFEASSLGVSAIIAPMVETRYALKKFLGAIDIAFTSEQQEDVEFFINIETITSCRQFDDMLTLPNLAKLDGVVIGRVDLTGSLDLDRSAVDGAEILALATEVAAKAKGHGLKVIHRPIPNWNESTAGMSGLVLRSLQYSNSPTGTRRSTTPL